MPLATDPVQNDTAAATRSVEPLTIWMLDPFCFTPWYTTALTKALQASGNRVSLFCTEFFREPGIFQAQGIEPAPAPLRWRPKRGRSRTHRALRAASVLLQERLMIRHLVSGADRPSVIHLQQAPLLNYGLRTDLTLAKVARTAGIPVVHTVHNVLPHNTGRRLANTYRDLYNAVDKLICHSTAAAERLTSEFQVPAGRLVTIPHGPLFATDTVPGHQDGLRARERLGLPLDRPIALLQGVISGYKGILPLLEAWRILIAERLPHLAAPPPLLLIAGTGDRTLEETIAQAAQRFPDSLKAILRYIRTDEIPELHQAADILLYPYLDITTSGALLTGLSYCKPIIASKLSTFDDFLSAGVNALVVEPGCPAALASALDQLVTSAGAARYGWSGHSPDCFRSLERGSASNRRSYTDWTEIAERTTSLYRELTSGR